MASCCSGRKIIGDWSMVISVGRSDVRFSLAACIARLAVCKSHSNHSTPMPSPKSWRLMPERRRILWISLSLRITNSFPHKDIDNSVCSKSSWIPAVAVYCLMRWRAASLSMWLLGSEFRGVPSKIVVLPIFRQPLWAISLIRKI